MARAVVDGIGIEYEVIGEGRPWTIMPGGRSSKDGRGFRQLGEARADASYPAVIWDRPNCIDLVMDGSGFGLGLRSRRHAMIIEDGVATLPNIETTPGSIEASGAEAILAAF